MFCAGPVRHHVGQRMLCLCWACEAPHRTEDVVSVCAGPVRHHVGQRMLCLSVLDSGDESSFTVQPPTPICSPSLCLRYCLAAMSQMGVGLWKYATCLSEAI